MVRRRHSNKHQAAVLTSFILLSLLGLFMCRGAHAPSCHHARNLTWASVAFLVAASLTSAALFASEASLASFDPPKDTYTFTGLLTTAIVIPLLVAAAVLHTRRPHVAYMLLALALLVFVFTVMCAVWERDALASANDQLDLEAVNDLYEMMNNVHHVLEAHGIRYFIIGGTLIGAVRHGGLIPWDDDIDIGMLQTDMDKLYSPVVREALRQCGMMLDSRDRRVCKKIYSTTKKFPFIDIFEFRSGSGDTIEFACERARRLFPKETFSVAQLSELQTYAYGPLRLSGPSDGEAVLRHQFGDDVMTHYYKNHPHEGRRVILHNRTFSKKPLTSVDRVPLLPTRHGIPHAGVDPRAA
jgi:hypothetical protein